VAQLDTDGYRTKLLDERGRVERALGYLHDENPGSIEDETGEEAADNHIGDVATVTVDREVDYTLEENSAGLLTAIDDALGRLDNGTFGMCARCGNSIGEERLEAMPSATKCIECKRIEERG
jgi:RNA polymerase-binding protein DksA